MIPSEHKEFTRVDRREIFLGLLLKHNSFCLSPKSTKGERRLMQSSRFFSNSLSPSQMANWEWAAGVPCLAPFYPTTPLPQLSRTRHCARHWVYTWLRPTIHFRKGLCSDICSTISTRRPENVILFSEPKIQIRSPICIMYSWGLQNRKFQSDLGC